MNIKKGGPGQRRRAPAEDPGLTDPFDDELGEDFDPQNALFPNMEWWDCFSWNEVITHSGTTSRCVPKSMWAAIAELKQQIAKHIESLDGFPTRPTGKKAINKLRAGHGSCGFCTTSYFLDHCKTTTPKPRTRKRS